MSKQSTRKSPRSKAAPKTGKAGKLERPEKPYADFPLFAHPIGQWAKKIRGKLHYFGRWFRTVKGKQERVKNDGWQEALDTYLDQKDDMHARREPRKNKDSLTVLDLCNQFLNHCDAKVAAGDMTKRTRDDYQRSTDRIIRVLGKGRVVEDLHTDDFAKLRADMAKGRGPVSLNGEITRARVVFNFASKNLLITSPVQYGLSFDRPGKKAMREAKAKNGPRMLEPGDCRKLIDEAQTPELKAMILLALNCGFGNNDCARLPVTAVDLEKGWTDFPRPKTGIERRCKLWPETTKALQNVLSRRRPERRFVFVTKYGNSYADDQAAITKELRKLLDETMLYRPGISFYALRNIFRTAADGMRDQVAVNHIMGHADNSMAGVYRENIEHERLAAVADHVHAWLFPPKERKRKQSGGTKRSKANKKNPNRISGRMAPVSIEDTSAGQRLIKRFEDPYEARQFFAAKNKQGADPNGP